MSIARNFSYPPVTPGARARCTELVVFPVSGSSFTPGSIVRYSVPLNRNQLPTLSEAYQSGVFTPSIVATTTTGTVSHSFLSLFDRATAYGPNGQVLEDIIQAGRNFAQLMDAQSDATSRTNGPGQMMGCGAISDTSNNAVILRSGLAITHNVAVDFAIPVPLGMFISSNRAFPAFAMEGGYLRIDLQLAPFSDVVALTDGTALTSYSYTLTNMALRIPVVEFDDETIAMIKASAGPKLHYPIFTWSNSQLTVSAAGSYSLPIGVRQRSMLYVHGSFYPNKVTTAGATNFQNNIFGNRCKNGLTSLQARIDGQMIPTNALTTSPQILAAIEQTFRDMGTVVKGSSLSSLTQFNSTVSATAGNGSFMFAIDLRNQPESSGMDAVFTGRNMTSADVVLNFTIASAEGPNLYTWWAHNRLLEIDALDGTATLLQ